MLDSSLFTKVDNLATVNQLPINMSTDGFEQDYENDDLIVYSDVPTSSSNTASGAIRIYNKKTNYYWCSDALGFPEDINQNTRRQLQSAFTINYRDEKDVVQTARTKETKVSMSKVIKDNTITFKAVVKDNKGNTLIAFSYDIIINNNKFTLLLDYHSIKEENNARLTSIEFFRYLGSAYKDNIPGYIFIPSGSGALIRYDQEPTISTVYTSAFYGEDANININNEGNLLNLPIYGVVHGIKQNALLVNIKDGTAFAKLNYTPSSAVVGFDYHTIHTTFNYRETYQIKISNNSISVIPSNIYPNNIEIEYTILSDDDATYVGMAKDFRQTLISENILTKQQTNKNQISLDLECFGRDYEMGLILKKYYNMTTTKDIIDFNNYLKDYDINNIFYSLRAFNKKGYSNQSVSNYKFDQSLGSLNDLADLEAYFYYNPIESYNSSRKYPSKVLVNLYNEKNYIKVGVDKYKFYANMKDVKNYTIKAIDKYTNIALDGIGYRLYGDNNNKLSRTDSLNLISNLLGANKYPLYKPNYYMLANTSKYLNIPMYCERLRFYTDSVPFLQILLKGYIDYYSSYLNFSSNEKLDILKCIEYGCYPTYLVTKQESYLLSNTLSSNYYATTFDNCKENIVANYQYINKALKEVIDEEIIDRITLDLGVYLIQYSNNKAIIVNYTNEDYLYDDLIIASLDYQYFNSEVL